MKPLLFFFLLACSNPEINSTNEMVESNPTIIHNKGNQIQTRFLPPNGYFRQSVSPSSYTHFLRQLTLKPDGSPVLLFNGQEKPKNVHEAVLTLDVGNKDLQQCADAAMRIRAEYLYAQKRFNDIHFKLTNGFEMDFSHWQRGYRVIVKGNTCTWVLKTSPDSSYPTFRAYLSFVYNYAGSLSLSRELENVKDITKIQPGDLWVVGGSPGHVVTVVDCCENKKGEKLFMIAQSYMPAQDIHILQNRNQPELSPWYAVSDIDQQLFTPEYTFDKDNLMRFAEE